MHKMGGFTSHSHMNFCMLCQITPQDKKTERAFQNGAFKPQTNQEHCDLGDCYHKLLGGTPRKNFIKEHVTCYSQLAQLPYFDLVDQIVVGPMHNLFLGLVETHFYNIWVQSKILHPNHKLVKFHEMLADVSQYSFSYSEFWADYYPQFIIPGSCGKLPTDIGMPSGGLLMADQWLLLATVYGPIIVSSIPVPVNTTCSDHMQIPQLWSSCLPEDTDENILHHWVVVIEKLEAKNLWEAKHKAINKKALEEAKNSVRKP
ncbi:hypothetical protein PAXRUDRAFT_131642 [Paxillus rubicundulus Ve08.2h10]|uniref:Uncharacterized protein n=1 Tax=Paxillus rubicundulus Ve08.2h10 TaxID=930991 RepID=A0A0D0E9Q1_9AGAM|nr:hypothetical protein PAXRUDRAFT_131642 [Paxillus rubicundulus Ve08.2h10]